MYKGCPVKRKGAKTKIETVGEMIYSYRITRGLTQADLSIAMGAEASRDVDIRVSRLEKGHHLPCFQNIYMLSKVLSIERESFFNMVLKEHYNNFLKLHHEKFFQVTEMIRNGKDISSIDISCRYCFCMIGKLKHNFSKFSATIKDAFLKKDIAYRELGKELRNRYSHPHIYNVINGKEVPGLKILLDLCDFFRLDPFKVYKIMVEEKALAHAKHMMLQWDIYKRERENGE